MYTEQNVKKCINNTSQYVILCPNVETKRYNQSSNKWLVILYSRTWCWMFGYHLSHASRLTVERHGADVCVVHIFMSEYVLQEIWTGKHECICHISRLIAQGLWPQPNRIYLDSTYALAGHVYTLPQIHRRNDNATTIQHAANCKDAQIPRFPFSSVPLLLF